ncbi:hypothetical protein COLSTE_00009 [Collinsella stercoris DSM 13279]|uniref:Uncharacterized protein n=1 Tax=Collinsella stercoris DSM 13279 TaxID=445975 RepID=B6G7H0_9ACTN|nr:hypothetical protein COLSTE_00009 [Collinsella stercoris DSM 13279]
MRGEHAVSGCVLQLSPTNALHSAKVHILYVNASEAERLCPPVN